MKSVRKNIYYALAIAVLLAGVVTPALADTILTTVDTAASAPSSMALNASGFPVISYDNSGNLKLAVCNDAACTAPTFTIVDSTASVGEYSSLALNASGFPVISYFDRTNFDLKLAVCNNATCTAPTITTVDSAGSMGEFTSLVLNSSGFPVISYFDITNGDMKLAVCNNATCTAPTLTTVDSGGAAIVGEYSSLALNASGFPVISYYDRTNGDLKLAVCNNATCTAPTITIVDSAGDVGWYTSLKLNASGFPIISYRDRTNHDLKLALCKDAACTAPTFIIVEDGTGFVGVGGYTVLALNASGFPVISYFDFGNTTQKLATFTPPTVASHTLQASYAGTGPSSFTVTFSEDVSNPAGDTNTDDVTNPGNYKIINKGANGNSDTASCASAIGGDDLLITPSGVTYTPNTATVSLASALPVGSYRLFVCGTTSIVSQIGVPLAGNGVTSGTDFTFDFTVGAPAAAPSATTLPATGFPQGRVTNLPQQPASKAYAATDLVLEIPSLHQKMTIVGVPQSEKSWDVSWLGNNAGWLAGSAFPTWNGNTVLTGHVWDSYNQPGPFANLKSLKYGDQILIHAFGMTYTYEVRESKTYWAKTAVSKVFQHEELDWVTLVTCETYNPLNGDYFFRRAVRAVLVSIK